MMEFLYTLAAAGQAGEGSWFLSLVPVLFIVFIFYFVLMRPQLKQQKEHQKLIDNIKKGDKVITSGGIWGEIDSVDAQAVRLRIGEKTKLTVSRGNIAGFQPKSAEVVEAS